MEEIRKTKFEMEDIIQRCFEECISAGYVERVDDASAKKKVDVIINKLELARHISKTLMGELLEFEMCNRLAPYFREHNRLQRDSEFLADKQAQFNAQQGLRINPSE